MTQRTTAQMRQWYQANEVWPGSIGFDPDGMCQKICRTARNIGPGFASALAQQVGTPREHRVYDVEKAVVGMVGFFDDPADENPYGHIATLVGRVKGADRGDLASCLFRTNSVKENQIVVVRGDYFQRYWGDEYQFFGKSINGTLLDLPEPKPEPAPEPEPATLPAGGIERLKRMVDIYDEMIDTHEGKPRIVKALRRDKREIRETIEHLRAN
jgi:hypothetical protein